MKMGTKSTKSKQTMFAAARDENAFPSSVSLVGLDGVPVTGTINCEAGPTRVKEAKSKDTFKSLHLRKPIYVFENAALVPEMRRAATALLFDEEDFSDVKNAIHGGAFGRDYAPHVIHDAPLQGKWVVVWKLPADLNGIDGYRPIATANNVGTYPMNDDGWTGQSDDKFGIKGRAFTKMRMDVPKPDGNGVHSVHHLVDKSGVKLAGLSTGILFKDFYAPSEEEKSKTKRLLKQMEVRACEHECWETMIAAYDVCVQEEAGVTGFVCNAMHHLIVWEEDTEDGTLLTPQKMARMLQHPERGKRIVDVLMRARFESRVSEDDLHAWRHNYISTYLRG